MARSLRTKTILVVMGVTAIALGSSAVVGREQLGKLLSEPSTTIAMERPAQPVRVTLVTFNVPQTTQTFTGTVQPEQETVMAFRQPGKIVAQLVEVGDTVAKGDLLAHLDDTDVRLSPEAAEAEVYASQADLSRAVAETNRSQRLFETGFLAKAGLEKSISVAAEAQARLDRALRIRDQAANALIYTRLTADIPSVVTSVTAESGQVVAAGQAVVTLAPTSSPDVVFALPEQMRSVLDGATATAQVWGEPGRSYALRLRYISPNVDPTARTYRVRMALGAADVDVALGRTMTVTLKASAEDPVTELPLSSVMNDGQGTFVWRLGLDEKTVHRVPVVVVGLSEGRIQLRGGLAQGDLVISLGAHKIDPARPVRVVESYSLPEK